MSRFTLSRRGLLGLGAAATLTTGLSACGGGSKEQQGAEGKLSFLVLGPTQELTKYLTDTAIPAFTKASGTEVEVQTSDWGSAFQKVTTGAASNSLADVLVIGGIWTAPLVDKNVLLDLTDKISSWDEKDQIYPRMLEDGAYEGKNYAMPIAADVRSGIYRKDILEAAGITSLPETWDDFKAAALAVKGADGIVAPIDFGLDKSIGLQQAFAQLFLQAGGKYWTDGKASFNSEAGTKALTYFVSLFQEGLADPNMIFSGNGPRPIVAGQAAMSLGGVAIVGNAEANNKEIAEHLVVGPGLKSDAGGEGRSVAWINKLAVSRGTKNPEGAWELVKYLASAPQMSEISRLYDALPPRRDLASAEWIDERRAQILATAEQAVSQPPNPKMLALGPEVNSLLEPAIRGTVSVEDTLKAIDAKVDTL